MLQGYSLNFFYLLCLDIQTINRSLFLEVEEPLGMNQSMGVKVKQICKRIGENLDCPRQATKPAILIRDLNKVRDNGKQCNDRHILIQRKLEKGWIDVLSSKVPKFSSFVVTYSRQYEEYNSLFLAPILVSKLELFNVTILWK